MVASLMDLQDSALSVAGLTEYIQALLEGDDRLHHLWVIGEVSSAKQHGQGCFFSLQEPDGSATINCVVWRSQLEKLTVPPVVGEQVVVLGQMRVYAKRGSYQLTVWQVLPGGEGLQALRYRQLRSRLAAEGLFDQSQKQALPTYPDQISVVTSPQAAAWGDIQRTLLMRHPGLKVLLSPATVQGAQAPISIVRAIERIVQDGRAQVVVLARGGGATEDLVCFDDERVVRAIALCPIPVVTGIGHERDESLADLVADVCAHTPTAAAETVVSSLADLYGEQAYCIQRLTGLVGEQLVQHYRYLQGLRSRLQQLRLDSTLQQKRQVLGWQKQYLVQLLNQRLQKAQSHHHLLQEKLVTLDPQAVLRRGYAVLRRASGEVATEAKALEIDETVTVQLSKGQVRAKVLAVEVGDEA